jgi:hypothetical protein
MSLDMSVPTIVMQLSAAAPSWGDATAVDREHDNRCNQRARGGAAEHERRRRSCEPHRTLLLRVELDGDGDGDGDAGVSLMDATIANDACCVITARTQRCYRTAGTFSFPLAGSPRASTGTTPCGGR